MNAAWFGSEFSVRELLASGADLRARNTKGWSSEDLTRERGHLEIAELLRVSPSDGSS